MVCWVCVHVLSFHVFHLLLHVLGASPPWCRSFCVCQCRTAERHILITQRKAFTFNSEYYCVVRRQSFLNTDVFVSLVGICVCTKESSDQGDHQGQQWALIISENGEEGVYFNFNYVHRDRLQHPTSTSCMWEVHYNFNYLRRDRLPHPTSTSCTTSSFASRLYDAYQLHVRSYVITRCLQCASSRKHIIPPRMFQSKLHLFPLTGSVPPEAYKPPLVNKTA